MKICDSCGVSNGQETPPGYGPYVAFTVSVHTFIVGHPWDCTQNGTSADLCDKCGKAAWEEIRQCVQRKRPLENRQPRLVEDIRILDGKLYPQIEQLFDGDELPRKKDYEHK